MLYWGNFKDNMIHVARNRRRRFILDKHRLYIAVGRLRIRIMNPFISQ